MESGLGHKGHMSSVTSLYFFNFFLVGIILWRTLKENFLSLLSLDDSYISLKLLFQSVKYGNSFFQDFTAVGSMLFFSGYEHFIVVFATHFRQQ